MMEKELAEAEIGRLREQIAQLQAEKENWLAEKVYTVQKIKREEPPDYRETKKRLKELEKKNRALEKVMHYGRISSLNDIVTEYQAMSKVYLAKIAVELECYPLGAEERQGLLALLEYLGYVADELRSLLIVEVGEGDERE
jgi:hypothetical protein